MNFNSYESGVLEALQMGVNAGMDPSSAFGVYQQMAAEAQQRQAERAALIQQTSGGLQELALGLAQQAVPMENVAGLVMNGMGALGQGPRVEKATNGLMGMVGSMYNGQGESQIVDPSLAAASSEASLMNPDVRAGMMQRIAKAIAEAGSNPAVNNVEAIREQMHFMFADAIAQGEIDPAELDQQVTDLWYSSGGPGMGMQGLAPLMEGHELLPGLGEYVAPGESSADTSAWGDPSDSLLEAAGSGGGLLGAARVWASPVTWPVELLKGLF